MKSFLKSLFLATVFCTSISVYAIADIAVTFDEGAPKDRFTFTNTGACNILNAKVTLDLSSSKSGLIFDVTGSGAGVNVFQPLEIVSGADALYRIPETKDGDNQIVFDIRELKAGQNFAFTIDVDDTMGGSETIVVNTEIEGAKVDFLQNNTSVSGFFDSNAETTLSLSPCKIPNQK